MKVWITKYALTQGLYLIDGYIDARKDTMFVRTKISGGPPEYYNKPYWHKHKADALRHAHELRLKRVDALKRSITKIEGLKFR